MSSRTPGNGVRIFWPDGATSASRLRPDAGGKLTATEEIWRQRALEAERRAEQALAAARADLAPHLAQALKEALVQELAIQRKELLQAQQIAIAEIAQLTHHLDELKVPMQERLRSYETRIQELEKELAAQIRGKPRTAET